MLNGLSLRDLEYVIAVADLGHFGRAAQRCAVSQPALSAQIAKLEDTLGIVLFERSRRGVFVTPPAQAIILQARRTVAEARRLLELAHSQAGELSGELHLWSIATLGPYLIPHVLKPLRTRFPRLELIIGEGLTDHILEGLASGDIDAAFLSLPVPEDGLAVEHLFFEPFIVAHPPDHPLADAHPLSVERLRGDDLLLLDEGHCLHDQALRLCGSASRVLRHAGSLETVRHLIAARAGYSILPALAVGEHNSLADLITYALFAEPGIGRRIALVWRCSDPRAVHFVALADVIRGNATLTALLSRACGPVVEAAAANGGSRP
jgi:LysR family hydrogen peroxide-inducible transcriptional activator